MNPAKTVHFLLVDDDEVDQKAVRRAFRQQKLINPLYVARDGVEALELIRGTSDREPMPGPRIVLLDLNMPRMNGIEFLKEVRRDPQLRGLVVFVLTTSDAHEDRLAAYGQNVAGYVVKSSLDSGFSEVVRMLDHYWRVVELPE